MSVMVGIISRLMADDWTDWMRRIAFDALHWTHCNSRRTHEGTRTDQPLGSPPSATWAC